MGVHQSGEHHAAGQVDHLGVRVPGADPAERASVSDHTVGDHDPGVGLGPEHPAGERRLGGVQNGAAIERHRVASAVASASAVIAGRSR
jgi:hypothetical protein